MATNAFPDTSAHPTKDEPTCPKRDTRKGAQDGDGTDTPNNPPNHGHPTHGRARFLAVVDKDTPLDELGDRYQEWQRRQNEGEQAELTQWGDS